MENKIFKLKMAIFLGGISLSNFAQVVPFLQMQPTYLPFG